MSVTHPTASVGAASPAQHRTRNFLVVVAGALVAVAANAVVAAAAVAAGADSGFAPLQLLVFAPFTILGVIAAYAGWRIVRRRAGSPAAVLRVLVPVLTVLSFVPDAVLALTGFIPGASVTGVVGLALMHLVVVGIVVPLSARIAPVR
jgi:hypothetical protein